MTGQIETTLRGPDAFALARRAMDEMERAGVWPTPLNFELWLHYLGEPDGALGREIARMIEAGEPFTETISETLAASHLLRGRLTEEIRDAGVLLSQQLSSVAETIAHAQKSQASYSETLADATSGLEQAEAPKDLKSLVDTLKSATLQVHAENNTLEQRLGDSRQEIASLREHLEQVRRDAMTDALTSLANRKAFDEALLRTCEEADKSGAPLTLAVLDIDHFKRFNDTWGHQTGDQVLRYVASVLGRVARDPRIAARYGGEEFAMIFPQETAPIVEAALNAAREEIATRALRRRSTNEDLGAVTISIGIAQRRPGELGVCLLGRADEALYVSKRSGRNRVTNAEKMARAAA